MRLEQRNKISVATTVAVAAMAVVEIEKAIDEARFAAFMQNGATTITLKDIEAEAVKFKPLAKTRPEEFAKMRSWAEERCRVANTITN